MSQSTGIESADAVVDGLGVLDDLPVADHVAVFERAHETLRALMSQSPDVAVGESLQA